MKKLLVKSPADGALVGEVPVSTPDEIRLRVDRAAGAFSRWRQVPLRERVQALRSLRSELLKARKRIAELIAREQGKPLLEAYVAEIFPCLDMLSFLIHKGPPLISPRRAPHFQPFLSGRKGHYHFHPYGPWALLSPWNYPFCIPFLQASVLVFSGNTVVLKPSPLTPLCGELVRDLFQAARFPEGAIGVVQGGAEEGELLVRDNRIRGVLFTGGVEGGRKVMAAAADGLKKVVLELGGKDAALVLSDAPLERAARGIAWSAMLNAGQTCASVERVFVEEKIAPRFHSLLEERIASLRVGHPLRIDTDVGPLTASFQLEKVAAQVEEACRRGARVAVGGKRLTGLGELYYSPTVVHGAPPDASLLEDETFGPVVAVETVSSAAEAVRRANETRFGLTASVWTRDRRLARSLARQLECGVVTVNSHLTSYGEANSAWGGFHASGLGKTHGEFGLLETVQVKYIDEGYSEKPEICWYPYGERLQGIMDNLFELLSEPSWTVKASLLPRFLPHIRHLARHAPLARLLPGLLRYLT
jgi:succinate-semialdehyde dehydrogenase/glutarate-semialdehyde dehydrogenase